MPWAGRIFPGTVVPTQGLLGFESREQGITGQGTSSIGLTLFGQVRRQMAQPFDNHREHVCSLSFPSKIFRRNMVTDRTARLCLSRICADGMSSVRIRNSGCTN